VCADRSEESCQRIGDPRSYDHSEDDGVERELDQHAACGRNALGYGAHEALRRQCNSSPTVMNMRL